MEILIIGAALMWLWQNMKVETAHAARGTVSPRWQRKLERMRQAGDPAIKPTYGSKAWAADLWGDFLEAKTADRRARTELAEIRKALDEIDRRREEGFEDPEPEPVKPRAPRRNLTEEAATAAVNAVVASRIVHDAPLDTVSPPRVATGVHPTPTTPSVSAALRAATDAKVIPMFGKTTQQDPSKESAMTNPTQNVGSSEVTGLNSAIQYAQDMSKAFGDVGSGETFKNGLAAAGHGPTVLAAAHDAYEKASMASLAFHNLAKVMADLNKSVQEAYDTSGGEAADKDHLTSGR